MTNYTKLNQHINFNDKLQMNEHIAQHKAAHCYQLNDTDKHLLTYISRYACRYVGVAYLKVATMCKILSKSTRTIRRSLNTLEGLGIIKRIKTTRLLGGQGANIIQIQQYVTPNMSPSMKSLKLCESKHEANNLESKPIYSQNQIIKDIKTSTNNESSKSNNNLYNRLKSLIQARKGHVNNFRAIVGVIYSKLKKIKSDASTALTHAQLESIMYQSLDALLNKSNVNNELAMLNAIINTKINDVLAPTLTPAVATQSNGSAATRTELVPEWFSTRNDKIDTDTAPTVDFDMERARILAKLGY